MGSSTLTLDMRYVVSFVVCLIDLLIYIISRQVLYCINIYPMVVLSLLNDDCKLC